VGQGTRRAGHGWIVTAAVERAGLDTNGGMVAAHGVHTPLICVV